MEGFNFESFLEELWERDAQFLDRKLPETDRKARERLLRRPPCEAKRDFKKYFPEEIHWYFDSPFHGTYYRIAPATAAVQFPQTGLRPMVFLTPRPPHEEGRTLENDFLAYFGCDPEMLAKLVKDKWIILLWAGPEGFKDEKNPYRELFKRFFYYFKESNLHEDRGFGPFFSNSIEESIARGCFMKSWKDLRSEEEKNFSGRSYGEVEYTKGLKANPGRFLPERIAWLRLVWGERAKWFTDPLEFCTLKENNPALACKVAFVFHELFTAPIVYARGCLHSVDYDDISKHHVEIANFLKDYITQKYVAMKVPQELIGAIGMLLNAYANPFRFFTRPEFEDARGHVLVRLIPKEGLQWMMESDELERLRILYQKNREGQAKFANLGFQGRLGKDIIDKDLLSLRKEIQDALIESKIERKTRALEYSKEPVMLTLAGVYMGVKQTTLGLSEFDHALVHLLPEIRYPLELLWNYCKPSISREFKGQLESEWQSLNYLPPLCIWRIPENEARRLAQLEQATS